MKKFAITALCATFCCAAVIGGCATQQAVGISSIQKTGSDGLTDIYTIFYTDGSASTFEVTNGADGEDGANGKDGADGTNGKDAVGVTVLELYEEYVKQYGEISYAEFLELYIDGESENEREYTVINECLQSVAKVYCEFTELVLSGSLFRPTYTEQIVGYTGASVVYSVDEEYTYFLTNYHVVFNANATDSLISNNIHVYLYGSEAYPTVSDSGEYDYGAYGIECEYVGGAITYDLAIIRAKTEDVKKVNPNVKAVEFSEDYCVGQTAIAIGNPNDEGISVTKGIISVDNEYIELSMDGTARSYRSIRIDTALYTGNSGGGLFNDNGELIGIANAGSTTDQNINFAVPLSVVKGVTKNILYYYNDADAESDGVCAPNLGLTVLSQNSKYVYDEVLGYGKIYEDVIVNSVLEESIVQRVGLQVGDKITKICVDEKLFTVQRQFDIDDIKLNMLKGSKIYFVVERGGEEITSASYTIEKDDIISIS